MLHRSRGTAEATDCSPGSEQAAVHFSASTMRRPRKPAAVGSQASPPGSKAAAKPRTPMPTPGSVMAVCERLEEAYRSPRHGNPTDPLDVLIYIIISNRTAPLVARRVYEEARVAFPNWKTVLEREEGALEDVLTPAGLANKRGQYVRALLRQLQADFGQVTLSPLEEMADLEAERYLCGLPGVSRKVAKCVLLYGLGRPVLPVDVHVHRIAKRLGWHRHRRADQSHDTLEAVVPPELRYGFHVNCVALGRELCRPRNPKCVDCPLKSECSTGEAILRGE